MSRSRKLGWFAVSLLVGAAAASPAVAHDSPEGKQKKQKIIIMTDRHDGAKGDAAGPHHGTRMVVAECGGEKTEVSGSDEGKGEKAKVVICNRSRASVADRAKRLEHVITRINANDELSAETKAKITTALRDAIARLNTAR
jgi:hypothetical protein